ncbi:MAG: 3-isopropylmalate dehydratase large subunit [Fimbriimonadaceae bacterium]
MARTLFEKVWDNHVVTELEGGGVLLYIDRHLIHEVTSPQAFDGLREAGRSVRRPDLTFATVDHNVPTDGRPIDPSTLSGQQLEALRRNCEEFGVKLYGYGDRGQGIVHVIGPQMGITLPGLTIVCGDSHTSTHGAFGALAFGIGTTEVEHVLATQTLRSPKQPKTLAVNARGQLGYGVTAKDLILYIIRTLGAGGGTGHVVEYRGDAVRSLSMQGRMTMANMSIEMGARAGMIAPDDTTFEFIAAEDRPFAPKGADLERMIAEWRQLATDEGATFDREIDIDASAVVPQVTWGTTPAMTVDVTGAIPEPKDASEKRAQMYMGVRPGQSIEELTVNTVFLGSCTNSRIEDLRAAAQVMRGHKVASGVRALVVPGSEEVRIQAESEGLDQIFKDSGWEWHRAGCSMCLGMNGDIVRPGERSASTSNRPYEGRQGPGSRTHLVSPISAAAAAIRGHLADPRPLLPA